MDYRDVKTIPWQPEAVPTPSRVQARRDASTWLASIGVPLDGWIILGLEAILFTGIVPE